MSFFWTIALLAVSSAVAAGQATRPAARANLALHMPATASSIENDEHGAARANDGNPHTSWRADDEPEGGPEWWQVDLQRPLDLSGCQIVWPYDGKHYRFRIEGSADARKWSVLCDQTNSASTSRVRNVDFRNARQVRYVRIIITGFDEGCWASISEVKVFGVR